MNILLITADQWRGDHPGALGHPAARTPHLDALAREGTLFARHFTQAYPCGPARASLLTGLYAHKHRVTGNGVPLDRRHATVFSELEKSAYRPTLFGYTDTTLDPRDMPADGNETQRYGDPENVCAGLSVHTLLTEQATPWLAYLRELGYAFDPPSPDQRSHSAASRTTARQPGRDDVFRQRPFFEPLGVHADHSESAFLTDRFLSWLKDTGDAPFCAHISYIAPHPPFAATAPYHQAISPEQVPLPIRGMTHAAEAAQHPLLAALYPRMQAGLFANGLTGLASRQSDATIRHGSGRICRPNV